MQANPKLPTAVNFNRKRIGTLDVAHGGTGAKTAAGAASTLGIPHKPQIAASRSGIPNTTYTGSLSGHTDVRLDYRYTHTSGPQAVSQLQVAQAGFTLGATGEVLLGNDYMYEAAIELSSPSTYQSIYFAGQPVGNIANGAPYVLSDQAIGFDLAANTAFFLRQSFFTGNAPLSFPYESMSNRAGTDAGVRSPSFASQTAGTGTLATPAGGIAFQNSVPLPALILGVPAAPMPSVIYIGDSIANGQGDANGGDGNGNMGFIARGLAAVNGSTIPYHKQTVGSWTLSNCTLTAAPRLRAFWKYATHIVIDLGTNDISQNGTSAATCLGYIDALTASIKNVLGPYGKPPKIAVCTLIPRTTSTDTWETAANQTPVSGMTSGGARDTYNAGIKSRVGNGYVDAVIDPNVYVEDPNTHGVWISNGTANYATVDGIHPTAAAAALAAAAVNNWALTIAP